MKSDTLIPKKIMRKGAVQERGAAGSRSSLPDTPSAELFPFSLFRNSEENTPVLFPRRFQSLIFTSESLRLFRVIFHIPGKGQNWEINKDTLKHCPGSIRHLKLSHETLHESHATIPEEKSFSQRRLGKFITPILS